MDPKQEQEPQEPVLHEFQASEVRLCYWDWRRDLAGREATIFLAHATGFHARVWDPVVAHLPDRHVIAVDQRGHGRSGKTPILNWHQLGRDLEELVRHLDLEGAIGVGHSMGGHALTEAAAACPGAFRRLLLIDPVIASPGDYGEWELREGADGEKIEGGWSVDLLDGEPHPTARRKNRFESPQEMFERFEHRHPYSLFDRAALRAYCEHGLLPAPDGDGFVLACSPDTEAGIYMTSRTDPGVHEAVRALRVPVVVLRAKSSSHREGIMDFTTSPTWSGLAGEFPNGTDVYLPEWTHFLPMQAPGLVAEYVLGSKP